MKISEDYIEGKANAAQFFSGDFRDPAAFERQAAAVRARPLEREELAAVLAGQNRKYGCGPQTLARIDELAAHQAGAIVTGQQVGLFSGPLYTIFKAVTAIKLADSLNRRGPGRFVPVFWLASDDHDLAEVDHITLLDRENAIREVRCGLSSGAGGKIPVSRIAVPAGIGDALSRLADLTRDSEFKPGVIGALREDYAPGRPFVEAFARWMTRLFGPSGLVFVDGSDPRLRELGAEVFVREIEGESPSTRRAREASARLKSSGYEEQVKLHDGILNLFYSNPDRRTVLWNGSAFVVKESGLAFSKDELAALAREQPALFSPNVLLRPIYQDAILPTAAYVGGPGEIAYFGQLKGAYEAFGLPMPILYPRKSVTVVEKKIGSILSKYGLAVPDLWRDAAGITALIEERTVPPSLSAGFAAAAERLDRDFEGLKARIAAFEPTLEELAGKTLANMKIPLGLLEKKVRDEAGKRDEVVRRQLRAAADHLYPCGGLQERVFNIVPFLIKYGFPFVGRLADAVALDDFGHQIVNL